MWKFRKTKPLKEKKPLFNSRTRISENGIDDDFDEVIHILYLNLRDDNFIKF